jgi:predicted dehydrogenase
VAARAAHTRPDITGETLAAILLETATGTPTIVSGSMTAPGYPTNAEDRLEMIGSKASASLADAVLTLLGPKPRSERYDAAVGYQMSFDDAIAHFVNCLETGTPFETGAADNLETLRLVEDAYRAAGLHAPTGEPK